MTTSSRRSRAVALGKIAETPDAWLTAFQRGRCSRAEAVTAMRRLATAERLNSWLAALDAAQATTSTSAPADAVGETDAEQGNEEQRPTPEQIVLGDLTASDLMRLIEIARRPRSRSPDRTRRMSASPPLVQEPPAAQDPTLVPPVADTDWLNLPPPETAAAPGPDSVLRTNRLAAYHTKHIADALYKFELLPKRPAVNDSAIREAILRNRYVDLPSLLPHGRAGIQDFSDWAQAWTLYREAVLRIFPWRAAELDIYHAYQQSWYVQSRGSRGITPASLAAWLDFDILCREQIASQNTYGLHDVHSFSALERQLQLELCRTEQPAPPPTSQGQSTQPPRSAPKRALLDEPCIRWNENRCFHPRGCNRLHVCSRCKSKEHRLPACPKQAEPKTEGKPSAQ
jgi:hypothetical protein